MAGIWTYLIPIIVIVALGTALRARRRPPTIKENPGGCSNCATPMSLRRISIFESPPFKVQWMCPHCRRVSNSGRGARTAT
jgi:hypothetical protein